MYQPPEPFDCYLEGWRRCFNSSGRSTRSEYWWFTFFSLIVSFLLIGVDVFIAKNEVALIYLFYSILAFMPTITVFIRRLHDTGRSGWWFWLQVIPIIGPIIVLIFLCQNSEQNSNKYGANPKSLY